MVEDNRRWGFEEAEDWEQAAQPAPAQDDGCTGTDGSGAVSVVVEPDGRVRTVRLAAQWRDALEPRSLGAAVVSAVTEATMRALARAVEAQGDLTAVAPPPPVADVDETPFTRADAERLFAAVNVELAAFTAELDRVVNVPVRAESRGGHVSGTAQAGQVVAVEIDGQWSHAAPGPEVEGELAEVLRALHGPPVARPAGPAIAQLQALASDPARLLRKVGLA
ncbi:YbaB/EbfC family nucleoid-associated protein [Lentzea sp.]|uniref:YbaB/EbfC family nucleoid-associated protein n=1 Tax=Lentzea sp. TaxID=56099 RepID=UPI002ED1A2B8